MTETHAIVSLQDKIRSETRNNVIINLILNAGIAYATVHSATELTTWGENGFGSDLFITGFLLSAILGAIFIVLYRRKRSKNEILLAGDEGQSLAWLLPFSPWLAVPWMGLLGAALGVPPLLGLLALLDVTTLTPIAYALIKGIWAAALAATVVPIAIRQGLRTKPA